MPRHEEGSRGGDTILGRGWPVPFVIGGWEGPPGTVNNIPAAVICKYVP